MIPTESISIKAGEKQLSNTAAVKTYFSGRTPTHLDVPLGRLDGITRQWSRSSEDTESLFPTRSTVTSYLVKHDCTLKMFSIYTSIGNRKAYAEIFLKVAGDAPKILIYGYHGFGEFVGRAHILTEVIPEGIEVKTLLAGSDTIEQVTGLIF